MPKTREEKKQILKELKDKISQSKSIVFTDYKGMSMNDLSELRKECKQNDAEFLVTKKTLMQKSLEEAGVDNVNVKEMEGQFSLIVSSEDEVAPAKIAAKYAKDKESFSMLGGIMEQKFMDLSQVEALSKLPSKEELLAKVVGSLNAPVSGFVNVLAGNLRGLVNALNAIKDQKAE